MPIEKILVRIMEVMGVVFIVLDLTYYEGRSSIYLFLLLGTLFTADLLLNPKDYKQTQSKRTKIVEKVIIGLIIITIIGFASCLAFLWKLGPFGHLQ